MCGMASRTEMLYDLTVDSGISGNHIYKDIWVPIIGEILFYEQEPGNKGHFAVAGHQLSVLLLGKFGLLTKL